MELLFKQAQAGQQPVNAAVDINAAGSIDLDQAGHAGFKVISLDLAAPGNTAHQVSSLHDAGQGDDAILIGFGHEFRDGLRKGMRSIVARIDNPAA
jgi:hypothetical protein